MNPIHQCFQKISPGNHFSYVRDVRMNVRTYVCMYVCTDKGDALCPPPPPIINGGGIKTLQIKSGNNYLNIEGHNCSCRAITAHVGAV